MNRLAVIPALAALAAGGLAAAEVPVDAAALAPPDTSVYLHLEDAAALRRDLAGRPLLRWAQLVMGDGQVRAAWRDLAARAGVSPERLFDAWLGRSATYLARPAVDAGAAPEWAVVADVGPAWADALERRLRLRPRGPRGSVGVAELPEHALLVAREGRTLVVGPRAAPGLFRDTLARLGPGGSALPALDAEPPLVEARGRGPGRLVLALRHGPPLGGWSAIVGTIDGERVPLRHASEFARDPLSRRRTAMACDFTPLEAFEGRMLVAFAEPTDVGEGLLETYLARRLGVSLLGPELRDNLGPRRVVAVGEEEGRRLPVREDILAPTVAVCFEVKDAAPALAQLDAQLERLSARLEHLGQGAFLVDLSQAGPACGAEPRRVDVSGATDWFTGGFPIMRNTTISWTVTQGPESAWCVVASSPRHLDEVAGCLQAPPPPDPAWRGRFDNAGLASGRRVSRHLRSWAERADAFAAPPDVGAFRRTLEGIAALADGVERCRWRLARPREGRVELEVELILSGPDSDAHR